MGKRREARIGKFTALERWLQYGAETQEVGSETGQERGQGRQGIGGREEGLVKEGRGSREEKER